MKNNTSTQLKPDYPVIAFLKNIKDRLLSPIINILKNWNVHPDWLSLISFLMIIPIFILFPISKILVMVFILISVFFDALDGSLARANHKLTKSGSLIDLLGDHFFLWFVFLTMLFFGFIGGFWAVFYLFNYVIFIFTLLILNFLKIPYFFVFKSIYIFYLVFLIYLLSVQTINLFFPYFLVFSVYMFINNVLLLNILRRSI